MIFGFLAGKENNIRRALAQIHVIKPYLLSKEYGGRGGGVVFFNEN